MNIKKDITNHKHSQTNSIVYYSNLKSETSQTSQPPFEPNQTDMPRTSSSRPTASRAHQYRSPPGEQREHEQRPELEVPEWARGEFILYIRYLHAHVPERMIFSVLRQTGLGMMRREGAIELTKHEPREAGGYPFQSAKIYFTKLFTQGPDAERNLQTLEHLRSGGDAHFQVVYQAARTNPKTGKPEPDRYWKLSEWVERGSTPADSPATKITLAGGSVGPKDAEPSPRTPQVVSDDGWSTVQSGPSASLTDTVQEAQPEQKVGGGFAALASSPPRTMTKTALKNAKKKVSREARKLLRPEPTEQEVAPVVALVEGDFTDVELLEVHAQTVARENKLLEIAEEAALFLGESQLSEAGEENCATCLMDTATGSVIYTHDEMSASYANTVTGMHQQVLDTDGIFASE